MGYIELNVLNNETTTVAMGIDLGTTNSLAALWQDGRPVVIKPDGKNGKIPSVVQFPGPDMSPLIGGKALEQAIVDPRHTIFSIKRLMGRGLADVQDDLAAFPFPVSENERGLLQIDVHGKPMTPQEISSLILMRVHDLACRAMSGNEVVKAVITVPAYFDEPQRQATRDAARLAGIEVLRIINEPTAASLAYGLDRRGEGTVVVYDLGGGTFDVSILRIEDGVFRVLATSGDTHLGGDDFDRALIEMIHAELSEQLGENEFKDPAFLQAAKLAAEKCKLELSVHPSADLHLMVPHRQIAFRRTILREDFEAAIRPLVERTLDACRLALSDAGLTNKDIDEVVMVGGSTRVPAVLNRVEAFFERKPHTELNPDEVVALGAAVQAHVLTGGSRDILLMDVIPLSLGLETMGGAVDKLIARNSTIPCQSTEGFTTHVDNQTGIDFNIVQGERELASDCRSLGRFKLTGIPPMPAGMPKIAVRFHVDADGLLTVSAKEESSGAKASIEIQPMHGLTDDEVEGMLKASFENAQADFDARRVVDLKAELETMLRVTEKHLDIAREQLDPESLADLEDAVKSGKHAMSLNDPREIQMVRDGFERATLPLAALLMDSVAKSALAGKKLDEV